MSLKETQGWPGFDIPIYGDRSNLRPATHFFFKKELGVQQPRKRNAKLGLRMAVRRKGGRDRVLYQGFPKRVGSIKHQYIAVCSFMQSCRLLSLARDPELPPGDCQWADKVPAEPGGLCPVGVSTCLLFDSITGKASCLLLVPSDG